MSFNLAEGASLGEAVDAIKQAELEIGMPASMITVFQGGALAFQAALGTFVDGSTSTLVHDTDEQVTIDWGDGTTTSGSVKDNGDGTFSAIGSHTYLTQTTGTPEQINVTVTDPAGQTLTFSTTATVQNAANALAGALKPQFDSLQANLNSKIFSNPLPLVGKALANSPACQIVSTFETGESP